MLCYHPVYNGYVNHERTIFVRDVLIQELLEEARVEAGYDADQPAPDGIEAQLLQDILDVDLWRNWRMPASDVMVEDGDAV